MDPSIRRELKTKILDNSQDYGLDDIIMNSYVKQLDSKTQISSTDMAYIISSILECPHKVNSDFLSSIITDTVVP